MPPSSLASVGSSPRVRGEVPGRDAVDGGDGIIPAGAGRRALTKRVNPNAWDHPRGCGEKYSNPYTRQPMAGSSPRVRGEELLGEACTHLLGIIPAGAGRSNINCFAFDAFWDHPRGCGEKGSRRRPEWPAWGSSPRVRGEGRERRGPRPCKGIIPAGAGRSREAGSPGRPGGDHPRGCGEKDANVDARVLVKGSSPRVRGEGQHPARRAHALGIIPAGAGRRASVSTTG